MRAVMAMLGVDGEHSVTNNVAEIEKFLGIEAARKVIIQEIVRVMSAYGIQIDHRHTMLLADCMTFKVQYTLVIIPDKLLSELLLGRPPALQFGTMQHLEYQGLQVPPQGVGACLQSLML